MFTKNKIDAEIEKLHEHLDILGVTTDSYKIVLERLDTLYGMKSYKTQNTIGAEVIFTGAISLASLLIVLNYEKLNVVSSKAFGMIFRGQA